MHTLTQLNVRCNSAIFVQTLLKKIERSTLYKFSRQNQETIQQVVSDLRLGPNEPLCCSTCYLVIN